MTKVRVMPEEHFSEDQIKAIEGVFTRQVNRMFTQIVGANIIALLIGASAVGVGWYRLGHMEDQVASVTKAISEGPRFTQEEGDALRAAMTQRDEDLQRQIDAFRSDQIYIRQRVDQIYNLQTR